MQSEINKKLRDGVRLLDKGEIRLAAECNVQSYGFSYPLHKHFFGRHFDQRTAVRYWEINIRTLANVGVTLVTGEKVDGIGIFLPPGFKGVKTIPFVAAGGLSLPPSMYRPMLAYESYAMSLKKKHTAHDSWYLYDLAVRPQERGRGLARSLLGSMLSYIDQQGQRCYLETHDPSNVPFYEKFGFSLVETGKVPRTDVAHYVMLR